MKYLIVEKQNHNAVHGIFDNEKRAQLHLLKVIPLEVKRGYFQDKSLTANSFMIIEKRSTTMKHWTDIKQRPVKRRIKPLSELNISRLTATKALERIK